MTIFSKCGLFPQPARRADELAAAGDTAGAVVWCRIIDAVDQLSNTTPPGRYIKGWQSPNIGRPKHSVREFSAAIRRQAFLRRFLAIVAGSVVGSSFFLRPPDIGSSKAP